MTVTKSHPVLVQIGRIVGSDDFEQEDTLGELLKDIAEGSEDLNILELLDRLEDEGVSIDDDEVSPTMSVKELIELFESRR